jgi:ferritin
MKLSRTMESAINKQITAELYSAYLYLAMSAWFEKENWKGAAKWMTKQSGEEIAHAMKFFHYVISRGGTVELAEIEKPKISWKSMIDAFTDAYDHEIKVTKLIHGLVDLAGKEHDAATVSFLTWFVDEQVEEEEHASEIVANLEKIGDSKNGQFMLDHQLSKRE